MSSPIGNSNFNFTDIRSRIQEQVQQRFQDRFAAIDANGNNSISLSEVQANAPAGISPERIENKYNQLLENGDINKDGELSKEEFSSFAQNRLSEVDRGELRENLSTRVRSFLEENDNQMYRNLLSIQENNT